MVRVLSLFSGSLASRVATRLVERHPEVGSLHLLYFRSPFARECDALRQLIKDEWPRTPFRTQSVKKDYQSVLALDASGGFSLAETCRRCRAMLLSKAARYMDRIGAEFLVIGDVGKRHGLTVQDTVSIAQRLGLEDRVLAPLLHGDPLTVPASLSEWTALACAAEGGDGCDLRVRNLGEFLGLHADDSLDSDVRCRLASPGFGERVAGLFAGQSVTLNGLCLLDFPMYMTADPDLQMVLARDEQEKRELQNYFLPEDLRLYPATPHGPMMLVRTNWETKSPAEREEIVELAARLTATLARSDGERLISIYCRRESEEERQLMHVAPFGSMDDAYRVCGLEQIPLVAALPGGSA